MNYLAASTGSLSNITSGASELLTWAIDSMSDVANWIVSTPITLTLFVIMLVSFGFGLVYRALHKL